MNVSVLPLHKVSFQSRVLHVGKILKDSPTDRRLRLSVEIYDGKKSKVGSCKEYDLDKVYDHN